jgi:hypothetical protein
MRYRFEKVIREAQNSICAAIEEIDGTKFRQVSRLRVASRNSRELTLHLAAPLFACLLVLSGRRPGLLQLLLAARAQQRALRRGLC